MKKEALSIFIFFLFFLFFIKDVSSFGIGTTEEIGTIYFEPNLEKEFTFVAIHRGMLYEPYVKGDLAEYVTISEPVRYDYEKDTFKLKIKFPESIEKKGTHKLLVGVYEKKPGGEGMISVALKVQKAIYIEVPYIGKYITISFTAPNANVNETIKFEISASNLGEEDIQKAKAVIDVFDIDDTLLSTLYTEEQEIKSKETKKFSVDFSTEGYKAGEYKAAATLTWDGNKTIKENYFKIGSLNVKIINYTKEVKKGAINKFSIIVESRWNSQINNLFVEVKIKDNDNYVLSFLTPSISLAPWKRAELIGYLDASEMDVKEYDVEIILNYEGKTTVEKGKINVMKEARTITKTNIIIISLILVIVILVFLDILILKKKRRK